MNKLGHNMSLNICFLFSHMDFFPENFEDVSDEEGKDPIKILKIWKTNNMGDGTEI